MSTDKENSTSEGVKAEESGNEDVKSDSKVDDKATGDSAAKGREKDTPKKKPKAKESKKEPKSESEDNDENEEKEGSDGKVPLLDQPLELSGARERKKVTRFSEEFKSEPKEAVAIEIPEGSGTPLGEIPIIESNIQRYKSDDLKALHRILFNRLGKVILLKKNIRKFNGFDFDEKSDLYVKKKQALQKCENKVLNGICYILDLKKGTKQDNVDRIMDFLMKPTDSGKAAPAKRSKRSAKANKSYSETGESEDDSGSGDKRKSHRAKGKRKSMKEVDLSEEEMDNEDHDDEEEKKSKKKVKGGRKKKESKKESEDEKDEDEKEAEENNAEHEDENEEEDGKEEEEEASSDEDSDSGKKGKKGGKANNKKAAPKKETPKKPAPKKERKTAKKRSSNSDDESSEDEPLMKKSKNPPTDEEIRTYVKEILEGANLEETTMKTVCKQVYAHYPDFDLSHKKDFIKTTVKSLIST